MKRVLAVFGVVIFTQMILAQAPPQMPKPGPAHKRIGYFAGHWTSEGEMKQSPFGPPGKFTIKDHNEWLAGGFFLVLRSEGKGPMGEMKGLAVMGYKDDEKAYFYSSYDSMGMTDSAKGTVQGDTWTWMSEPKMGGKAVKSRFTIKELSPTSYTFRLETSADGASYSTVMEGKATKVK
jgi:Protein of unknown function (DUF1579)